MRCRRTVLPTIAVAAAISSGAPIRALAQAPGPSAGGADAARARDPAAARRWLAAAQILMQRGSYHAARNHPDEARRQFEDAAAAYRSALLVSDDPQILVDLAIVEDRLGKPDEAVRQLRIVIRAGAGVRAEVLRRATAKLDELSAKVGLVTLAVEPVGTSITLGGSELGTSPLPEALVLLPGTYTLSFEADGFEPREAEIKVEPGAEIERAIDLAPVPVIPPPAVAPVAVPVRPPPPPRPSRLAIHVGATATAAALLGATVCGLLAVGQHATFTDPSASPLERNDARVNGRRLALAADLSLATAVVAAGATVLWYRYKYGPALEKSRAPARSPGVAKVDVVPWVQSQSGGVSIAGRF
jgi:hypothetical protein